MKRVVMLIALAAAIAIPGAGFAADCGPGGSEPNGSGSCKTSANQTRCGDGVASQDGVALAASESGAELCIDGADQPVQGRLGAQQDCSCAYIDGDDDNNHALLMHGWIRVDETGISCRDGSDALQGYEAPGQPFPDCII